MLCDFFSAGAISFLLWENNYTNWVNRLSLLPGSSETQKNMEKLGQQIIIGEKGKKRVYRSFWRPLEFTAFFLSSSTFNFVWDTR